MPLVLLAMRWRRPSGPWVRIATILSAARSLRTRVRPEATLGQDGTNTVLGLVPDDARARQERGALARSCDDPPLTEAGALVDLVPVPEQRDLVPAWCDACACQHPNRNPRRARIGATRPTP